jgi:hypothetical protein
MLARKQRSIVLLLLLVLMLSDEVIFALGDAGTQLFAPVQDINNSTFYIAKLDADNQRIESCYEVRRKLGDDKGFIFCYPAVSIDGFGGCATQALQHFLAAQPFVAATVETNLCPNARKPIFEFFKTLASLNSSTTKVHLNTCLWPSTIQTHIAQILSPRTASIFVVCNQPDRAWNIYNMYCDPLFDKDCEFSTNKNMYRSPMMFDQYLRMQQAALALKSTVHPVLHVPIVPSCTAFEKMYSHHTLALARVTGHRSLVLASEALRLSSTTHSAQINKIQAYLNEILGSTWTLDVSKYPQEPPARDVSQGGLAAAHSPQAPTAASLEPSPDGLYEISQHRPLLPVTVQFIMSCWKECMHISQVTGYNYNCSQNHLHAGASLRGGQEGIGKAALDAAAVRAHILVVLLYGYLLMK